MTKAVPVRNHNPERTRGSLLRAATRLFSTHGYDGVAVDDIVQAAGVNKRMVYHYFQNKEGLYAEVLRSVFSRLAEIEQKAFDQTKDPADGIRQILVNYFQFLSDNPEFVSLLSWENLRQGRFIDEHPHLLSKNPVIERLKEVLAHGIKEGVFRDGIDARHLLISLISVCFVYHSNRYTLSHSVGLDLHSPAVLRQGLSHSIDLVLNGLLKRR